MAEIIKLTDEQLAKLKQLELEMLKVFIGICEKHNLKYFLLEGTCLGAVRHKGFIPWDDDIDVGMFREDYEKFLEIAPKELPDNLFLQNKKSDPNFIMNFSKIRNSETTFIESTLQEFDINHGVFIDLFPLDGYPKQKFVARVLKGLKNFCSAYVCKMYITDEKVSWKTRLIWKLPFLSPQKLFNYQEKLYKKYKISDSDNISNGTTWGTKLVIPKECFGEGAEGEFEGVKANLPQKYDEYLTRLYGDYMTPPPPEQRVGHHYVSCIDLENSYKLYKK